MSKSSYNLSPGDRVARIREKLPEVIKKHGLIKDKNVSKKNGREIYTNKKRKTY